MPGIRWIAAGEQVPLRRERYGLVQVPFLEPRFSKVIVIFAVVWVKTYSPFQKTDGLIQLTFGQEASSLFRQMKGSKGAGTGRPCCCFGQVSASVFGNVRWREKDSVRPSDQRR